MENRKTISTLVLGMAFGIIMTLAVVAVIGILFPHKVEFNETYITKLSVEKNSEPFRVIGIVIGSDEREAKEVAMKQFKDQYKEEDQWTGHKVELTELKEEVLRRIIKEE